MADARPIGLFDSGVGGLTVLREVLRRLPRESTLYLGDNLRAPYGTRSDAEVRRFSAECLDVLVERDVKAIVVACNTSTAVALSDLRRRYDVPILGVVRPGATAAALATRTRHVGVIATPATIRSHAYFQAIKDENPFVEVYEHATPEFVPLVEAGRLEGPAVEAVVRRELAPLFVERPVATRHAVGDRHAGGAPGPVGDRHAGDGRDGGDGHTGGGRDGGAARSPDDRRYLPGRTPQRSEGRDAGLVALSPVPTIDTLLLGCTHYPLLEQAIRDVVGSQVAVIDSASATASVLADLLAINDLLAPEDGTAVHAQLTTGDVERFRVLAERLFGPDLAAVEGIVVAGAA